METGGATFENDAPLVRAACGGDPQALDAIYRRHAPMVRAVLLARVGHADADDLTQDVFVRAWSRLDALRDPRALGAWLAASARRAAKDHARAASRRARAERQSDEVGPRTAGSGAVDPRAEAMLDALRGLSPRRREALLMRFVAGLTGPQIAARMGMTHASVRVHLHRGMEQLRSKLEVHR